MKRYRKRKDIDRKKVEWEGGREKEWDRERVWQGQGVKIIQTESRTKKKYWEKEENFIECFINKKKKKREIERERDKDWR